MTLQPRIDHLRQDSLPWTKDGKPTGNLIADQLCDALAIIAELEARLAVAHGTLNPIREQDWHDKWRVLTVLAATDLAQTLAGAE